MVNSWSGVECNFGIKHKNLTFTICRACRLKKKAQHEANKVKLQGLEMERRELFDLHRLYCDCPG